MGDWCGGEIEEARMEKDAKRKQKRPGPQTEMLDVVDRYGNPTGEVVAREEAHRMGILHRTAHVWLVRKSRTRPGCFEVLIQKRSPHKDSFPGCYDISSAGHIPAGAEWIPSALRELSEELGVAARPRDLHFVGKRMVSSDGTFHGRKFRNRQVSAVYFLWCDCAGNDFSVDPDEVASVRWMEMGDLKQRLASRSFPNCISATEIDWLRQHPAIFPGKGSRTTRFSADHGPKALFERVHCIVKPADYFDRVAWLRVRRLDRVVPDINRMCETICEDPSAWQLVGAETRTDTGKFVRSHWNIRWRNRWYRLVLDKRGNVYNIKEIPDGEEPFGKAVARGPDYKFAERVNRALMDTTMGCNDRSVFARRAKGLMN